MTGIDMVIFRHEDGKMLEKELCYVVRLSSELL